jgi:hypothetical protein
VACWTPGQPAQRLLEAERWMAGTLVDEAAIAALGTVAAEAAALAPGDGEPVARAARLALQRL